MKKHTLQVKYFISITCLVCYALAAYGQNLSFSLVEVSNDGNNYIFDVELKADNSGTYHSRGMVYLNYNSEAFGEHIHFNNNVTVSRLDLLNEPVSGQNDKYSTINIIDNTPNTLAITWALNHQNQAPSNTYHTLLPTISAGLFQISFSILNPAVSIDICFNENLMDGQQFKLIDTAEEQAYDSNIYNNCLPFSLPIELLTFKATLLAKNTVNLNWRTTNETEHSHFEIEKSTDTKSWLRLGKVNGLGTSHVQPIYNFEDKNPAIGWNYYRLKQVDLNGKFQYSKIENIHLKPLLSEEIKLFPNPASSEVYIVFKKDKAKNYTAQLWNSQGILIQHFLLPNNSNKPINIEHLERGIYFLQIQNQEDLHFGKLIKN